jgi:hypothetical protein
MTVPRRIRRVLFSCVASNVAFAVAGLATVGTPATAAAPRVAATHRHAVAPAPTSTSTLITEAPAADTSPRQKNSAPRATTSPSSHGSSATRTPTTRTAAAADEATGIASSAAPPTIARSAPGPGHYPAAFAGSASVNGRAQPVPTSGSVVFTPTGSDLRQSSPDTPGDVKITQRFSSAKASLVSFQLKAADATKIFTPASPATFIQYAGGEGSWTWSASSSDGATHVSASGHTGDSKTTTVGGQSVDVFEVVTSLDISGDISGTAELTMWVSALYRLPIVQRQVINAKGSSGYGFSTRLSSDVTQTLTQLTPSSG